MAIGFPKPRPRILEKRERSAKLKAAEEQQRKLVRLRSGGRCEVQTAHFKPEISELHYRRCQRRATQMHHLIGGNGRRGVGPSGLAGALLHTCQMCHAMLHGGILTPLFDDPEFKYSATQVRYERREL